MSHSRTMVSAVDPQNTSFSSSAQSPTAMELSSKPNETKAKDTIELPPESSLPTLGPTPVPTSTENAIKPEMNTEELLGAAAMTNEQMPIPTLAQSHNKNINNSNNQNDQINISTNVITPRTIKRIALVGGDIILEEEEGEEEEEEMKTNQKIQLQTEVEEKREQIATTTPPPPAIMNQRPTPVYVNASVLHQKKNQSYGQNINVIPDNKNSTKLLTKPKL